MIQFESFNMIQVIWARAHYHSFFFLSPHIANNPPAMTLPHSLPHSLLQSIDYLIFLLLKAYQAAQAGKSRD